MSYSRWGDSRWYTYWRGEDNSPLEEQVFQVDTLFTMGFIPYVEMKADFEAAVARFVKEAIAQEEEYAPDAEEIVELRGYMREFMAEVEAEFGAGA